MALFYYENKEPKTLYTTPIYTILFFFLKCICEYINNGENNERSQAHGTKCARREYEPDVITGVVVVAILKLY